MNIRYLAIIPARKGSKRLPGKNMKLLNGMPLVEHSLIAASGASSIDAICVTSDDSNILELGTKYTSYVINRPLELAGDEALSSDVVLHAVGCLASQGLMIEYIVLLQPTSPLRTAEHLQNCIESFEKSGAQCAISVAEVEHHPYKAFSWDKSGYLQPLFGADYLQMPQQALPKVCRQNGAIYITPVKTLQETNSFFAPPVFGFEMARDVSVDIDTEDDFLFAEQIIAKSNCG